MKPDENVLSFMSRDGQLASVLMSMGVELDDSEIATAVPSVLHNEFYYIINTLDAFGKESLSHDLIKSRLFQEEKRFALRKSSNSRNSVLLHSNK